MRFARELPNLPLEDALQLVLTAYAVCAKVAG
jgi:hypothetical protein